MINPSDLVCHIEWLSQARVLCIGDLMLDRFVYGEVERTSPEAPVPVLGIKRQTAMLGGVGNVARNLISLGSSATLLSVVGDDEVGRTLTQMIGEEERIEPHLLVEPGRPSTEKTRFLAGGQQLLRTDRETRNWISDRSAENLLRMAEDIVPHSDVLVLSDYAKGILTAELCQALIACALDDVHYGFALVRSGGDVEEHHLIRALLVVLQHQLDGVAHVAQFAGLGFAELHTTGHLSVVDIEAGNDAFG